MRVRAVSDRRERRSSNARGASHRLRLAALAVVLLSGGLGLAADPAGAVAEVFTATLSGAEEVPANGSAGTGTGFVYLDAAETRITVDLSFSGLGSNANAAHIHGPAAPGANAVVLFPLNVPAATSGSMTTKSFAITPAQVADLKAGLHYFNVHSALLPGGEIRGQIRASTSASQLYVATLRGIQEVPANGSAGTGVGTVYLNAAQTQITVDLTFSGLGSNANNAHIHGPAGVGVNAAVAFGLSGVPAATGGSITSQVFNVTPTRVNELKTGQWYFNVHSTGLAGGEIRGQITPAQSWPALLRPTTNWLLRNSLSTGGETTPAFTYGDRPVPLMGDWDGNGSKTPGIYKNGAFHLRNSNTAGTADTVVSYGSLARGHPVTGDFDGNGVDDLGVFRTGVWQIRLSTGTTFSFTFGSGFYPGTVPIAGDWNGDGVDGIGTFTSSTATWDLRNGASAGAADAGTFVFGTAGASYPVAGDWDGDTVDTVGVKSSAGAAWSLRNTNSAGSADLAFDYGVSTDVPLAWR